MNDGITFKISSETVVVLCLISLCLAMAMSIGKFVAKPGGGINASITASPIIRDFDSTKYETQWGTEACGAYRELLPAVQRIVDGGEDAMGGDFADAVAIILGEKCNQTRLDACLIKIRKDFSANCHVYLFPWWGRLLHGRNLKYVHASYP